MGFSFQRRARGVRRRLAVAIVLGMAGGLAQGTTYTVNTTNDAPAGSTSCTGLGACNLRDAIDAANRHAGPDTVNFVAGLSGTITLGQGPNAGEIAITDDLTLAGPGADLLSLSGNSASRVFHIAVGAPEDPALTVTISGLAFVDATTASDGGAILAEDVNLTLGDCAFLGNHSEGYGGALFAVPTLITSLTAHDCRFDGNSAALHGGAFATQGVNQVQLDRLTVQNNSSTHYGGGVFLQNVGDASVAHSRFSANHAGTFALAPTGHGGGALAATGDKSTSTIGISDSRFENNVTDHGWGGALALDTFGTATLQRLEIAGNSAGNHGGGVRAVNANLTLSASTLSGNQAGGVGGGVALQTAGDSSFEGVTLAGNTSAGGGGLSVGAGTTASLHNSVLADNNAPSGPDAAGTLLLRYSLLKNASGATLDGASANNLAAGTSPQLGTLRDNGGPSLSLLPNLGSPLLDAGDPASSGGTDQRGYARVSGARVDIGATERQSPEDLIFRTGFDG